jgi:hypothetical protein
MTNRFAVAFLFGALALSPGWAAAEEEGESLEQLVVEMAQTPAEHAAIAKHYRTQADVARKLAQRHLSMGRAYVGGKSTQGRQFQNHCRKIAEQQEAMAQEYDALAKLQDEEAKKTE